MGEERDTALISDSHEPTAENASSTKPVKRKKRHPWRVVGIIVLVLALIAVLVAGWFGMVPGVSAVLGATKVRDLGVRYTAADFTSYQEKTGITFKDFATAPANPNKPGK